MNPTASTVALICGAVVISGLAWAQQNERGGPTPSPQGAAVHFVGLNDGAKLPTRVTIRFGLRDMGVAPAGLERANSGHHHLLIDCRRSISRFPTTSTTYTSALARPRRR